MMADCHVLGASHSFDVNIFTDWTECVSAVCADDGRLSTDNIHNVVDHCYCYTTHHAAYNIQRVVYQLHALRET